MRSDLGLPLGDLQGFAMGKIAVASRRSLLRIFVLALCALPMHGQTANTGAIAGTVLSELVRRLIKRISG